MAQDPAFLFYPGDYLRDTQCLSEATQVAYDRIMCEHMRNICISQAQLKFFTKRLTDEQKDELLMVLTETKEGFFISWVVDSIEKRRAYSDSRRNNRKKTPKTDPKISNNISLTYDHHMENEIEIEKEDEIDKEYAVKKSALISDILQFFNYTSSFNKKQQSLAMAFVESLRLHEKFDFFIEQFDSYKKLKLLDKFPHNFENFLGDQSDQFKNGKWDDNWVNKLKLFKEKDGKTDKRGSASRATVITGKGSSGYSDL